MAQTAEETNVDIKASVKKILETIDREREREIIARRFGLYDRRETLEQIGDLLGITRERVRQLEKAILARLKAQTDGQLPEIDKVEKVFIKHLHEMGRVARIKALAARVGKTGDDRDQAHVAFLATLAPGLVVIDENDHFYPSVGISETNKDEASIKKATKQIVDTIKEIGQPVTVEELHARLSFEHPDQIRALCSISKDLTELNNHWGLIKWPLVNPKNIRDKIYVVLREVGKPLHFSEISKEIRQSNFKRKDVTTQAIHNELIKDKRFVLIGRGIYALSEWGYKKGTVADIIAEVLKKAGKPLHRDEIVKRVLKSRQVKETTILLNLQGKPLFERVAKATYTLKQP